MSIFKVVGESGRVLLETDDWVEAESRASSYNWPKGGLYVKGTHPTHVWDDQNPRRCQVCEGWDNGSYGSHAPCGYDWSHDSLVSALEREFEARPI